VAKTTVIKCGRLITGKDEKVLSNKAVVIEGNSITAVGDPKTLNIPPDATVIEAGNWTLMPGLMDIHVHLGAIVDPNEPNTMVAMLNTPPPLLTLHAVKNARLMLEAGFTTVRDMTGYNYTMGVEMVSLRKGIEMGLVRGPRVFASGWVTPTAGHLDMGMPATWRRREDETADGPDEVRKMTRKFIRNGVDVIKTASSGGGGGYTEEVWWRNYTVEELQVISEEAHAYRKTVAVHAHTPEGIKRAIRGGCDTVEHGTEVDQEVLDLFLESGVFLVPTLSVASERALAGRKKGGADAHVLRKHQESVEKKERNFRKAHEAGVKIACGTDTYRALREYMGQNAYELELMVKYGMSPMRAIIAATKTAAEALGRAETLGTIEAGKLADMILVDGDPSTDVTILENTSRILAVIKDGQVEVDRRPAK
jgi:imidazolonepropionase-like amidohydrolase